MFEFVKRASLHYFVCWPIRIDRHFHGLQAYQSLNFDLLEATYNINSVMLYKEKQFFELWGATLAPAQQTRPGMPWTFHRMVPGWSLDTLPSWDDPYSAILG